MESMDCIGGYSDRIHIGKLHTHHYYAAGLGGDTGTIRISGINTILQAAPYALWETSMKAVPTKNVCKALRILGFRPAPYLNNATGHAWYSNGNIAIDLVGRKKDQPLAYLFTMAEKLATKGLGDQRAIFKCLRGRG
jgi:hypothetical protein